MHEYHEVTKKSNEEEEEVESHPGGEACEEETLFGNFVHALEPVLFAFAIEFVLIGGLEQNVETENIVSQEQQFSPICGRRWGRPAPNMARW